MTSPGSGKPVSRQWPLVSTSAGSLSTEFGKRTTEPEQLLSATVPAKLTAVIAGAAFLVAVALSGAVAAAAGAMPAPVITRVASAARRGLFMWGSPLQTRATGDIPVACRLVMHILMRQRGGGKKPYAIRVLRTARQPAAKDRYLGPLVLPFPCDG